MTTEIIHKYPLQQLSHQGGWFDTRFQSWRELKAEHWVFEWATPEGWIVMSQGTFLNTFRTNPDSEGTK